MSVNVPEEATPVRRTLVVLDAVGGSTYCVNVEDIVRAWPLGVHVEDLIGVSGFNGPNFESETFQQAMVKELTALANVGAANMEYLLLTTTQGKTLNPYDGSVAIDAFANTGTVRPTHFAAFKYAVL